MNSIKHWSLLSFSLLSILAFAACGNSTAVNKQANSNSDIKKDTPTEEAISLPVGNSKIQSELDKAKKEGKAVFVVVTGSGTTDTDKATTIAKGANSIYKNSAIVQMDRDDASNAALVTEWRLAGAPLPIILVISPKGLPTGGYIVSQATAENLAALIPSPKLEDVYSAIKNNKSALVVFTKKSLNDRTEVLRVCNEAVSKLNNKAVIVEVDMDDNKEVNFMNQLRIDKSAMASTTLVINSQGQVAGTSTTVPDATKLAAAATKPVAAGCGPGCGPAGCGK